MKTNNDTKTENQSESEDSDSDSSSSSSSGDSSDSDGSEEDEPKVTKNKKPNAAAVGKKPKNEHSTPKTNLDLLLSLDEDITGLFGYLCMYVNKINRICFRINITFSAPTLNASPGELLTPSLGGILSPTMDAQSSTNLIRDASPMYIPIKESELLSKMTTGGLQVTYRYTRKPHLFSESMTSIQLTLNNLGQEELSDIKVGSKTLAPGMAMHDFPGLAKLGPGCSQTVNIGINFNDSTQAAKFDLVSSGRVFPISIQAPVGKSLNLQAKTIENCTNLKN